MQAINRFIQRHNQALIIGSIVVFGSALLTTGLALLIRGSETPDTKPEPANQRKVEKPTNPLAGAAFYVDPASNAATQAAAWAATKPAESALLRRLAALPSATWITEPNHLAALPAYVEAASDAQQIPVIVSYYLPYRDCGRYSAGGAADEAAYKAYIDTLAAGIGTSKALVILEPDAVSHTMATADNGKPCLQDAQKQQYYSLLGYATDKLKSLPGTRVYIDAGNSSWITDTDGIAAALGNAGIARADGFSLNVSNFQPTGQTIAFGKSIATKTEGKHFVIDTSRNGNGAYTNTAVPNHSWCNPPDRALGHYPTADTGDELVDAFLYIKRIGESDGADPDTRKCFGGPPAGTWWPEYAVGLVSRWPQNLQPKQ